MSYFTKGDNVRTRDLSDSDDWNEAGRGIENVAVRRAGDSDGQLFIIIIVPNRAGDKIGAEKRELGIRELQKKRLIEFDFGITPNEHGKVRRGNSRLEG